MADYRSMYDKNFIGAWDLAKGDATLTIDKVTQGALPKQGTSKIDKRPIVHFKGTPKTLVLNVTNGKAIAGMYGPIIEQWVGKRISVFATTTQFGSNTVECVRVRPKVPPAKGGNNLPAERDPETHIDAPVSEAAPEIMGGNDDGTVPGL